MAELQVWGRGIDDLPGCAGDSLGDTYPPEDACTNQSNPIAVSEETIAAADPYVQFYYFDFPDGCDRHLNP